MASSSLPSTETPHKVVVLLLFLDKLFFWPKMDQFKNIFNKFTGGGQEAPQTLAGTAEDVSNKLITAGTNALNQISRMEGAILNLVTSPIVIAFAIGIVLGCLANLILGWTTTYQVPNQGGTDTNPDQKNGFGLGNLIRGWTQKNPVANQDGAASNTDQKNPDKNANKEKLM